MPAKEAADLSSLLRSIQSAKTPIERFKLAARSWRTVRALPRDVRVRLARQIGVEGVEEVLERLADGKLDGRASSKELLRILEEAERADPARAKALLASAKDVGRQKEMLRRAAEAIRQQVFEASAPVPVPRPEPPAAALPFTPQVQPPPLETQQPPPPAPAKVYPADPIPVPDAPLGPPPESPTVRFDEPAPAAAPPLPWPAEPPPEPSPSVSSPASTSTLRRFRDLLRDAQGLGLEQLRELIDSFPSGWSRRRALVALLRAGIPARATDAIFLIQTLESPMARTWGYGELIARGGLSALSAAEREEIRGNASPTIRRRLERSAARSG